MPKLHSGICEQCGKHYKSRGLRFCGNSCKATFSNLRNNPAKRPEVRAKIAKQATDGDRQLQMMTKAARKKANASISRVLTGRTLTEEHKAAIGRGSKAAGCVPPRNPHLIGPNHPGWKGGTRPARTADFSNPKYKAFRNAVLERDNWTCQKCAKRGGKLHTHHIKSWAENPILRYEISNGLTLCHPCHHSEHRNQPRPKGVGPRTVADLRLSPASTA